MVPENDNTVNVSDIFVDEEMKKYACEITDEEWNTFIQWEMDCLQQRNISINAGS